MAFPLLALLGVITISATALAWLYDSKTDDEQQRHKDLEKELEKLKKEFDRYKNEKDKDVLTRAAIYPKRWIEIFQDELRQLRNKIKPIKEELDGIFPLVLKEASNPGTDTFRRNMLKRQLLRFDEAFRKLAAYDFYLTWLENNLSYTTSSQSIGDLLQLPPPESTLPDFWLYPGKLILLPTEMLGKPLPEFGHSVLLSKWPNVQLQQMYFLRDGQESSPILIINQHKSNPNFFWGCALKGAFYVNCVLDNQPAQFLINTAGNAYYYGSMMEGAIRAILPRDNMFFASLNRRQGDALKVYPQEFDLLLQRNYTGAFAWNDKTFPIVSEIPDYTFSASQLQPLFMLMDSSEYDADICLALDDIKTPFNLLGTVIDERDESFVIILGKNGLTVRCHIDPGGWLEVKQLSKEDSKIDIGIELPLLIVPAENKSKSSLSPCPDGLIKLDAFIERFCQIQKRQESSNVATFFFDKWTQVLNFLQQEEGEYNLQFLALIQKTNNECEIVLSLRNTEFEYLSDFHKNEVESFWEKYRQELDISPNKKLVLSVWRHREFDDPGYWMKFRTDSIESRDDFNSIVIYAKHDSFLIEGEIYLFKLGFYTMQYAPLERQKSALSAMRDDRFANPELRNALLLPDPSFYKPTISSFWQERLTEESAWSSVPNKLSPNQMNVVRTCLSVEPLVLVQGPPGTGKTRCIVEIIYQFLLFNPKGRILISSQQNTAVDNVIERLHKNHKVFLENNKISILRIGNELKMSAGAKSFAFSTVLENLAKHLTDINYDKATDHSGQPPSSNACIELLKQHLGDFLLPRISENIIDNEVLFCISNSCQVVAATCVGLANKAAAMDQSRFDLVIIDEAGRAIPPELLIPMKLAKKAILIGDHYQLPPSVNSLLREESSQEVLPFLKDNFLDRSFFGDLFQTLPEIAKCKLTEQFRMDNSIGDLVAELFYTENNTRMLYNGACGTKNKGLIAWINVNGKHERVGTSLFNECEADEILRLLGHIDKVYLGNYVDTVAIITPYREQKKLLTQRISTHNFNNFQIKVNTIDQFQGSEADIVIYSTVRTVGPIDFLLDKKRLNVACSRAKHMLFFVGHKALFSSNSEENYFYKIIQKC